MPVGKYTKKLFELLDKCKVKRDQTSTHISMGTPVGCYNINVSKRSRLHTLMKRVIENEKVSLHLLEKHRSQGPLLFDIDINYDSDSSTRIYNEDDIKKTVEIYNKYINKYLNISDIENECFITEKKSPNCSSGNLYKDGFHGIFPNICVSNELQYLIRLDVVQDFKNNDYFKHLNYKNKYEDIFDEAIIERNGWLMYGCSKPKRDPYLLTYIIDKNLNFINVNSFKKNNNLEDLLNIFSIRRFGKEDLTQYNSNSNLNQIEEKIQNLNIKKNNITKIRKKSREYSEEEIEYAQKLVKLLSEERADNYQSWIEVGWALFNIDDLLLDEFIEFSQKSPKFINGDCEKRWDKMRNEGTRGVGLGSLIRWANEDNPEESKKLEDQAEQKIISRSLVGTSGDVARAFYHLNKGKFVCASIKHSLWYEFKNSRWQSIDSATTIMLMLNDEYPIKYKKLSDSLYYRCQQLQGDEKKLIELRREAALKLSEKLTTAKFKKEVIDELKHRFYDEEFFNKLDENRYLLGCKNGVFDLKNCIFREGYPDDYLSLNTHINYQEFSNNDPKIIEINKFFNDIQPENDMCDYILDYFSSCLIGHSPDELFHIWTGSGGNGKSLSIGLFQSIMGDYASTISITLLVNKRAASNAASPEMANCKGKRFLVFQEPENDDKIHVGHMKELTGNDKISARALFKEPIEFYPQFKTILTCNKLPFIPSNDGGTWRRLRVAPFEMKFVNNPNPEDPLERKKDRDLKNKMETWKESFLFLLIQRYIKRFKNNGLKEPLKVKQFTNEYQKKSDIFLEYINEHIIYTGNKKDKVNVTTLYLDFKAWYKESHSERGIPKKLDFKENLESKLGKMDTVGWKGHKLKESEKQKIESDDSDSDNESPNLKVI